jgi:hypothetical protein
LKSAKDLIAIAGGLALFIGLLWATARKSQAASSSNLNPTVTVGNTANNPVPIRDTDNAARQPWQWTAEIDIAAGNGEACTSTDVPDGKELVIENVSAAAAVQTGQKLAFLIVTTTQQAAQVRHYFVPVWTGTRSVSPPELFAVGQATRLYSEAGTGNVSVCADTAGSGDASVLPALSGYLVNVP